MSIMMRPLLAVLSALLLLASVATSIPTENLGQVFSGLSVLADEGVTYVPITFVGPVFVGGPNITITGNYQDIVAQMHSLNPAYGAMVQSANVSVPSLAQETPSDNCIKIVCGDSAPYPPAPQIGVQDSINFVKSQLSGYCNLPAGPKTCSRISCSWSSAVVWCNDEPTAISVECKRLGDLAQSAFDECVTHPDHTVNFVNGQCFAKNAQHNLNVGYADC